MILADQISKLKVVNKKLLAALELMVKEDGTPAQKSLRRANALHVIAKAKGEAQGG